MVDKKPNIDNPLTWKTNLFLFSILFILTLLYFLYQIQKAKETFINDIKYHAEIVSKLVNISAKSALNSLNIIDEVLEIYLYNTARFIEFLDSIEPFKKTELVAFSLESGLTSATIIRDEKIISTHDILPQNFIKFFNCLPKNTLIHDENISEILYIYNLSHKNCIIIGIDAKKIAELKFEVSLEKIITKIKELTGILYVNSHKINNSLSLENINTVKFKENNNLYVAEIILNIDNHVIILGLNATQLRKNIQKLWIDFIIFSTIIIITGIILSWFLWKQHNLHIKQVEEYEKQLYQKKEEALIGRAASAVAHEVRNPLNAISIGLQRLKLENTNLSHEYIELIDVMLDSLRRANNIISNLQKFAKIPNPNLRKVNLLDLLNKNILLYKKIFEERDISLNISIPTDKELLLDPDLISQVFQNLIKNAIEAQPNGGYLNITSSQSKDYFTLNFENTGNIPKNHERQFISEPYFTTKTRGIGLGLFISKKIIHAHKGELNITFPNDYTILISIKLPEGS